MMMRRVGRTRGEGPWAIMLTLMIGVALTAAIGGCNGPQVDDDPPPAFTEVRERYNQRTGRIDQLFSRGVVEVRWYDEDGRRHFEQGDLHLYMRLPSELAISVSKVGETLFWIGGDAEQFWFFNLAPPNGQPTTAIVGHHEEVSGATIEGVPVAVRPDQLVHLLGIAEMPQPAGDASAEVTREDGADVLTLPADVDGDAWWRYELDPADHLPRRITLLDGDREPIVSSQLERYAYMQRENVPPGGWPEVPTRIEITVPDDRSRLTLFLDRDPPPSDGKARDRIRDVQFDFDTLVEMLDPQDVRVVAAD